MKKATDQQILDLVNKYRDELNARLVKAFNDAGFESTDEVDEEGLLDEMLCGMNNDEFMSNIVDSVVDSVGPDSYGFECPEED